MLLYTVWILGQIAMSRLLLNVKSSQVFQTTLSFSRREQGATSHRISILKNGNIPGANRIISRDEGHVQMFPITRGQPVGLHTTMMVEDDDNGSGGWEENRTRVSMIPSSMEPKLPWWMRPRQPNGDLHVQVSYGDTSDSVHPADEGGLKISRLGRYDHWL